MKIRKHRLNEIIKEEIARIAEMESFSGPTPEEVLGALDVLSQADPAIIKENIQIFKKIADRIKNT